MDIFNDLSVLQICALLWVCGVVLSNLVLYVLACVSPLEDKSNDD